MFSPSNEEISPYLPTLLRCFSFASPVVISSVSKIMDSHSTICHELLSNLLSTVIAQLQQEPGTVDQGLFSKCFSTLFKTFDSAHDIYHWMIATTPSFLQGLFTIMSLLQTRGGELINENYL